MILINKNISLKVDTRTSKDELFEMRDILSIISKHSNGEKDAWGLRYYEFNDVLSPIRNNQIVEYLNQNEIFELNLSFQEIKEFADSIFQTIECDVSFKQNNKLVLKIINHDTNFWEITFYREDIYKYFLTKEHEFKYVIIE